MKFGPLKLLGLTGTFSSPMLLSYEKTCFVGFAHKQDWLMAKASREFQVFAKPVGAVCNLECHYCHYLKEEGLYGNSEPSHMPDKMLEEYIVQHIDAAPGPMISFSWHGGEPTYLWPGLFLEDCGVQHRYRPLGWQIRNASRLTVPSLTRAGVVSLQKRSLVWGPVWTVLRNCMTATA